MKDALGHGSNGKDGIAQSEATLKKMNDARAKAGLTGSQLSEDLRVSRGGTPDQPSPGPGAHAAGTAATPQLQRRHFEAIAAELKGRNAPEAEVHAMADKLATTNPGFRRDFFVKAATGGAYRFKGPGKNAAAVASKAKKFTGK